MCPTGHFSAASNVYTAEGVSTVTACKACSAGQHQPDLGRARCQECPAGQHQPDIGHAVCSKCAAGRYQPTTGAERCLDCPLGRLQAHQEQLSCDECRAGRYAREATDPQCTPCAVDTFSDTDGASECAACPGGQSTNGRRQSVACVQPVELAQATDEASTVALNISMDSSGSGDGWSTADTIGTALGVLGLVLGLLAFPSLQRRCLPWKRRQDKSGADEDAKGVEAVNSTGDNSAPPGNGDGPGNIPMARAVPLGAGASGLREAAPPARLPAGSSLRRELTKIANGLARQSSGGWNVFSLRRTPSSSSVEEVTENPMIGRQWSNESASSVVSTDSASAVV